MQPRMRTLLLLWWNNIGSEERGNYKELVEACFAHAGVLGKRFGQLQLDWRKIEHDLAAMLRKAKSMKKKRMLSVDF